ncbi:hypothetical protein LCGC14_1056820 [marine sediment metagenome]|uniref:Uncharacterized protein n=1 Tax=marine sediment metagenome TaxID=412755 RepID=A0A0F9MMC4_9ZZZZ
MAGLGIGGLVAGGIFVLYSSKKSAGAGAIRQLVSAAEAEFSSIAKEKLAEDTKAQKEYADQCRIEDERFQVVKTDFNKAKENIEIALIHPLQCGLCKTTVGTRDPAMTTCCAI